MKSPALAILAEEPSSEGKAVSDGLAVDWVQMCDGVRNNDQMALKELFQVVKQMSWPPRFARKKARTRACRVALARENS
jgi:hypothetical protein